MSCSKPRFKSGAKRKPVKKAPAKKEPKEYFVSGTRKKNFLRIIIEKRQFVGDPEAVYFAECRRKVEKSMPVDSCEVLYSVAGMKSTIRYYSINPGTDYKFVSKNGKLLKVRINYDKDKKFPQSAVESEADTITTFYMHLLRNQRAAVEYKAGTSIKLMYDVLIRLRMAGGSNE